MEAEAYWRDRLARFCNDGSCERELLERLSAEPGWRPTHRHVKRGTDYEVIGRAIIQTTEPLNDDEYVILYRDEAGALWARDADEFNDGRFTPLPIPPGDTP